MTVLRLTARERLALADVMGGARDGRLLRRAFALQRVEQGDPIAEIAADLGVSRQSIYNWVARVVERHPHPLEQRLADAARSGRPKTVTGAIDPLIDAVIDGDPREHGYSATSWTAPLLVRYLAEGHGLEVSTQSVRLAIDRLRIRWKRPRHSLARRSRYWRQAKGG